MINAENKSTPRELIPSGNYIARCYKMIEIGTCDEEYLGVKKQVKKINITWELPTELKVFKEEKGAQPLVISREFTLSMHENSGLRAVLQSWRGKAFTEQEAERFDVTVLLTKPCMLNIIHVQGKKNPEKTYEQISSITPLPKGVTCPAQINKTFELSYDNFSQELFAMLPDFIKDKMKLTPEYKALNETFNQDTQSNITTSDDGDGLPF